MARSKETKLTEQIEKRAERPKQAEPVSHFNPSNFVSSGSTLLNLALTDNPFCGWQKGKMANIIGDSGAGKTLLTLTALAETAHDPKEDATLLFLDDAENALEFDLSKVFGRKTEDRVELIDPPSNTIEHFSDNLSVAMKKGKPFIYILDSFDAIGSEADTDHIEQERKIRMGESKKESKGSYGMAKPKIASQMLREDCGTLKRSQGCLLIISQTRDNLVVGSFEKKTRSGGKALKFYATHEVWVILTKQLKSKDRRIGACCDVKVTKNKITGKRRTVSFNIFDGYGIDDVGSMIDFLLDEGEWSGGGAKNIDTGDTLGLTGPLSRAKLIAALDDDDLLMKLKLLTSDVWHSIEESLKQDRKPRYA